MAGKIPAYLQQRLDNIAIKAAHTALCDEIYSLRTSGTNAAGEWDTALREHHDHLAGIVDRLAAVL